MKKARRRIDVNLEELDRVLDGTREAPLSESDHNKLRDALHALAELLVRTRTTEDQFGGWGAGRLSNADGPWAVGPLSHKQVLLSDAMISYWTQFAKTGNPNSSAEPVWSPYSTLIDQFQSFIPPAPVVESDFATEHQCATFWDTF